MMFGICSRCSAGIMPTTQDRYTGRQCPDRSYTLGAEHTAERLCKSGTGKFEGQEFDKVTPMNFNIVIHGLRFYPIRKAHPLERSQGFFN